MRLAYLLSGLVALLAWFALRDDGTPGQGASVGSRTHARVAEQGETLDSAHLVPAATDAERTEGGVRPDMEARPDLGAAPTPTLAPGGLRVRVLDVDGSPAPGVTVALVVSVPGMGSDQERGTAESRAPDGLARLDLATLTEERAHRARFPVTFRFHVEARVAAASPVREELEAWPNDGDEVTLTLPPTGRVRVRVTDRDGAPVDAPASVGWWWAPADVVARDPSVAFERGSREELPVRDGAVVLGRIGLGLALAVYGWGEGLVSGSARGVLGPRAPGELVELELRLGAPLATIRFRMLDPAGNAMVRTRPYAALWTEPDRARVPNTHPPHPHVLALESDDTGNVSLRYAPGRFEDPPRLDLQRHGRISASEVDPDWCVASVRFPKQLDEGGVHDLGDVVFAPPPLLAAGRVVDIEGAAIGGARLTFRERSGDSPDHLWYDLDEGTLRTEKDGTFLLRGNRLPRSLGVLVHAGGFRSYSATDLPLGDSGHVFTLVRDDEAEPTRVGALAVHVVLEPEVPFLQLLLRVQGRGGRSRKPDWGPGARLEVDGLPPDTYDVSVTTRDGDFELVRVEGVLVRAGETAEDPRLLPLDARGLARVVTLEFTKPDGTPWRRASVEAGVPGERGSADGKTDDRGRVELVLPTRFHSFGVRLEESEPAFVTVPADGGVIRVTVAPPAGGR